MKSKQQNIADSNAFILTAINIGGALEWFEIGIFISWQIIIQQSSGGFGVSLAESLNTSAVYYWQ